MRHFFVPFRLVFLGFTVAIASCSGSSGGDAATSEAGASADGGLGADGGVRPLDGPGFDGGLATAAVDTSVDTAGAAGVDGSVAKIDSGRDAASGELAQALQEAGALRDVSSADVAQGAQETGGLRDAASDRAADVPTPTADSQPLTSTGNATVDRLGAAAAACGPQSRLTVPAGWQMVLAGEKGCAFYAPTTWQTIGAGTPSTFVVEDQTRVTGSSVLAGVDTTGTATCTPHGVATWLFANNKDCVGFTELYWKDGVDNVAGLQIPRGDLVYACTQSGVPIVGYLVVQIHGTWPLCNILAFAFWMPETQIEARTCTLTQTMNSIQCPQGGSSCSDSSCAQECVAAGNASGACTSDDSCYCTN
jgi:hypothetical protein